MARNLYSTVFALPASALKMSNSVQPCRVRLAATPAAKLLPVSATTDKKASWPQ